MTTFDLVLGLTLLLFGGACDRAYLTLKARKQKQLRRASLGVNYRKEPEPVWGRWSPEIGRGLKR